MKSGGGSSRGRNLSIRWGSRWRPPERKAARIRFIPAEYKGLDGLTYNFFQYVSFFSARSGKDFISSKEWIVNEDGNLRAEGGECLGWDEWQAEVDAGIDRDKRTLNPRLLHAFNLVHEDWYHQVPVFDKKGQPLKYKKGDRAGEQIYDLMPCQGRGCEYCKEGFEKEFGKAVHWSVGSGHLGAIINIMEEVRKDCKSCGNSGTLEVCTYECAECGHVFVNMAKTSMSDDEIYDFSATIHKCPKCEHADYPLEQFECSECQDPIPTSIFDVDIEVKRTGKGAQTQVNFGRWYHTELSEELAEKAKPFKFVDVFAPDPFDIQAAALKIKNPHGKGDSSKHTEEYEDNPDLG